MLTLTPSNRRQNLVAVTEVTNLLAGNQIKSFSIGKSHNNKLLTFLNGIKMKAKPTQHSETSLTLPNASKYCLYIAENNTSLQACKCHYSTKAVAEHFGRYWQALQGTKPQLFCFCENAGNMSTLKGSISNRYIQKSFLLFLPT